MSCQSLPGGSVSYGPNSKITKRAQLMKVWDSVFKSESWTHGRRKCIVTSCRESVSAAVSPVMCTVCACAVRVLTRPNVTYAGSNRDRGADNPPPAPPLPITLNKPICFQPPHPSPTLVPPRPLKGKHPCKALDERRTNQSICYKQGKVTRRSYGADDHLFVTEANYNDNWTGMIDSQVWSSFRRSAWRWTGSW